jgi:hypothetical protein
MKHPFRNLTSFFLFVLLICVFSGAAAADTSRDNCETQRLQSCNILTLKTNQYAGDRPVIIFFPGGNECGNIGDTAKWIRRYELYDHLDTDLVAVSFRRKPLKPSDWKNPCNDLLAFLKEKAADSPFPVIIDAVSLGGYGGCYLAQILNENGIPVKELNMADACLPRYITEEWLTQLAGLGTQVNLWGCGGKSNASIETRRLITALEGTENIRGVIVDAGHGAVLHTAIYEHGLHEEFSIQ